MYGSEWIERSVLGRAGRAPSQVGVEDQAVKAREPALLGGTENSLHCSRSAEKDLAANEFKSKQESTAPCSLALRSERRGFVS